MALKFCSTMSFKLFIVSNTYWQCHLLTWRGKLKKWDKSRKLSKYFEALTRMQSFGNPKFSAAARDSRCTIWAAGEIKYEKTKRALTLFVKYEKTKRALTLKLTFDIFIRKTWRHLVYYGTSDFNKSFMLCLIVGVIRNEQLFQNQNIVEKMVCQTTSFN